MNNKVEHFEDNINLRLHGSIAKGKNLPVVGMTISFY
jgi:hypothetical protein